LSNANLIKKQRWTQLIPRCSEMIWPLHFDFFFHMCVVVLHLLGSKYGVILKVLANFFQQTTIIKKKNRIYHTVRTSPKFNSKIVEKAKMIPQHTNTWPRTCLATIAIKHSYLQNYCIKINKIKEDTTVSCTVAY
jgi:NAD-specific glutamate dehydrogenase